MHFLTHRKALWILLGIIGLSVILVGFWYSGVKQQVVTPTPPNPEWKTYTNEKFGYEFQYPTKLELSESNSIPTLKHSIAYKNAGPCDMIEDESIKYDRLIDFQVSFEVSTRTNELSYTDGEYKKGGLVGFMVYEGAEYCGDIKYYFPQENKNNLIVTRASIQALSLPSKTEVLKVPGVISYEENAEIFDAILSTFRFKK